jgi:predicted enzyme related to lactoylglutathione lyase
VRRKPADIQERWKMLQPPRYGAVIYAKDYQQLARFYEQVAGLTPREVEKDYVVLEAPSFQLVILQIPQRIAATITIDIPPQKRESTPIKLVLNVNSLENARQAARLLGGELNGVDKEWSFNGVKRCDGIDPEGNVFQLQEVS